MKLISTSILICIIFLYSACKETSNNIEPVINSHRVKTILEKKNGYETWRCDIVYQNDKVIETSSFTNFNNIWSPEEISNFDYNINSIHEKTSEWRNNQWHESYGFNYLMIYSKLKEFEILDFFENRWITEGKYIYTYESDFLTERKYIELYDGEEKERHKLSFNYQDGLIHEIRMYIRGELNDWLMQVKQTFDYSHEGITEIYTYSIDELANWNLQQRIQLKYINKLLSESYVYHQMDDSNLWHLSYSNIYLYDSNDYLYKIIECDGCETEFIYEEGNGNANIFYSTPLMQIMQYPSLKSSSKSKAFNYLCF